MPTTLTLQGIDELLAALAHLAPDLAAEAGPLEQSLAERTADELRAALPVATGQLQQSVQVTRLSSTSPARVATELVIAAPYAMHVEFGTRYVPARPVFVATLRRGRQAFLQAISARVRDVGLQVTGGTD